jgi:hypothetical protein
MGLEGDINLSQLSRVDLVCIPLKRFIEERLSSQMNRVQSANAVLNERNQFCETLFKFGRSPHASGIDA